MSALAFEEINLNAFSGHARAAHVLYNIPYASTKIVEVTLRIFLLGAMPIPGFWLSSVYLVPTFSAGYSV